MGDSKRKLQEAGIDIDSFAPPDREVILDLTDDELDVLLSVKRRAREAQGETEGASRPTLGESSRGAGPLFVI